MRKNEVLHTTVFQIDEERCWSLVGQRWQLVTGWPAEECLGKLAVGYVAPEDRRRCEEYLDKLLQGERGGEPVRMRLMTPGVGEMRWVELEACTMRESGGGVTGLSGGITAIAEPSGNAGPDGVGMRSEFLAAVSQDVRTPLNSILGATELAFETNLTAEQQDYLMTIRSGSEAVLRLMNGLLEFSQIESGHLELDWVPFDPFELIEEVVDVVKMESSEKGLVLRVGIPVDLPPLVLGDPGRIRQILLNLADNAIRYTDSGSVTLGIEWERPAHPRGTGNEQTVAVRLSVSDTGPGIPADKHAVIFEKFARKDIFPEGQEGGAGLGLAISRLYAGRMAGRITVESEVGHGSTFALHLLLDVAHAPTLVSRARQQFRNRSVLLLKQPAAEWDPLMTLLRKFMGQVEALGDAGEAIQRLVAADNHCDLMMVDEESLKQIPAAQVEKLWAAVFHCHVRLVLLRRQSQRALRDGLAVDPSVVLEAPVLPHRLFRVLQHAYRLAPGTEMQSGSRGPAAHASSFRDETYRVLIAGSDADLGRLAERYLTSAHFAPERVSTNEEAARRAQAYQYELILVDHGVPDPLAGQTAGQTDGFMLAEQIRKQDANGERERVAMVCLVADPSRNQRALCYEHGLDDFLTKPFRKEELLEVVEKWVDRRPVILVVDETAESRNLLRLFLQTQSEYRLVMASSGEEAARIFASRRVSLIILSLDAPVDKHGWDAARATAALRQLPGGKNVVLLGMTSHAGTAARSRAAAAGCAEWLEKPVRRMHLLRAVRRLLEEDEPETRPVEVVVDPDISDLVPVYLRNRQEDLDRIGTALQRQDFEQILALAHAIRGSGAAYGLPEISHLGREMAAAAQRGDGLRVAECRESMALYLRRVKVR